MEQLSFDFNDEWDWVEQTQLHQLAKHTWNRFWSSVRSNNMRFNRSNRYDSWTYFDKSAFDPERDRMEPIPYRVIDTRIDWWFNRKENRYDITEVTIKGFLIARKNGTDKQIFEKVVLYDGIYNTTTVMHENGDVDKYHVGGEIDLRNNTYAYNTSPRAG